MDSVRLTGAVKPYKDAKWLLARDAKGLTLYDEDEGVVLQIPAAETMMRIRFPSFWMSRAHIQIRDKRGEEYLFGPKPKTLPKVKQLIEECAAADSGSTSAAFHKRGMIELGVGATVFVLALIAGLLFSVSQDLRLTPRGWALVGCFMLFGLVGVFRGFKFLVKARTYSQLAAEEQVDADDEEVDDPPAKRPAPTSVPTAKPSATTSRPANPVKAPSKPSARPASPPQRKKPVVEEVVEDEDVIDDLEVERPKPKPKRRPEN